MTLPRDVRHLLGTYFLNRTNVGVRGKHVFVPVRGQGYAFCIVPAKA